MVDHLTMLVSNYFLKRRAHIWSLFDRHGHSLPRWCEAFVGCDGRPEEEEVAPFARDRQHRSQSRRSDSHGRDGESESSSSVVSFEHGHAGVVKEGFVD